MAVRSCAAPRHALFSAAVPPGRGPARRVAWGLADGKRRDRPADRRLGRDRDLLAVVSHVERISQPKRIRRLFLLHLHAKPAAAERETEREPGDLGR